MAVVITGGNFVRMTSLTPDNVEHVGHIGLGTNAVVISQHTIGNLVDKAEIRSGFPSMSWAKSDLYDFWFTQRSSDFGIRYLPLL